MLRKSRAASILTLLLVLTCSGAAWAIDYIAEGENNYGACASPCNQNSFNAYNVATVTGFTGSMAYWGYGGVLYTESQLGGADLVEDTLPGGEDRMFGDAHTILALATHGGIVQENGNGPYRHYVIMCMTGGADDCRPNTYASSTVAMRLGERCGQFATPYRGWTRWVTLVTCHSIETNPWQQWEMTTTDGLEYIMGFQGLFYNSPSTDDQLSSWANGAFGLTWPFAASWFNAVDDYFWNNVGGVAVPGSDGADAMIRYANQTYLYGTRPVCGSTNYFAVAYHQG